METRAWDERRQCMSGIAVLHSLFRIHSQRLEADSGGSLRRAPRAAKHVGAAMGCADERGVECRPRARCANPSEQWPGKRRRAREARLGGLPAQAGSCVLGEHAPTRRQLLGRGSVPGNRAPKHGRSEAPASTPATAPLLFFFPFLFFSFLLEFESFLFIKLLLNNFFSTTL